jgi:hypothetical protein
MRGARRIERQRQAQVDLADEKIRPGGAVDEVGVLADPAEAGVARERLLQDGRTVDECPIAERAHPPDDTVAELLQTMAHQLVVIASESVAGDIGRTPIGEHVPRVLGLCRPVVQTRADAAHRPRDQLRRPGALIAVAAHVPHLAGETCPQPIEEVRLVLREVDVRHADAGEAELRPPGTDLGEQAVGIERCGARARRGLA